MGDSLPPAVPIDLVASYARLRDLNVELVLARPSFVGSKGALILTNGERSVGARGRIVRQPGGAQFVARVRRTRLGNGIWTLTLRSERAGDENVGARLLVQDERPLVLLWGGETYGSYVPRRRTMTPKRRATATAAHALDEVLARLPPERASRIRNHARSAARRLLKK